MTSPCRAASSSFVPPSIVDPSRYAPARRWDPPTRRWPPMPFGPLEEPPSEAPEPEDDQGEVPEDYGAMSTSTKPVASSCWSQASARR